MSNEKSSSGGPAIVCIAIGAMFIVLTFGLHILNGWIGFTGIMLILLGAFIAIW